MTTGLSLSKLLKFENAYYEGVKHAVLEEDEEAARYFEYALKIYPESGATYYQLSKLYTKAGNLSKGLQYGLAAIKLTEEYNHFYYAHVAQLYETGGMNEYSADVYSQMIENEPYRSELYEKAIEQYLLAKENKKAMQLAEKYEDNLGISEGSARAKAHVYYKNLEFDKALAEFEKLVDTYPENLNYKILLTQAYIEFGKYNEAYESLKEIDSDDREVGEMWLVLGEVFVSREDYTLSYECLKKGFSNPMVNADHKMGAFKSYFLRLMHSDSAREEAFELVDILSELHPDQAQPLELKADIHRVLGEYEESRNLLLQAIDLKSSNFDLWNKLLMMDSKLGNGRYQVNDASRAIRLYPNIPSLYLAKAYGYYDLENYDSTVVAAEEGLEIAVNDMDLVELWACKGSAYGKLEKFSDSDSCFERALRIDSRNALVLNNYAFALAERGQRLEYADSLIEVAMDLSPDNPYYLDTKAWIAFKQGDTDLAIKLLNQAVKLDILSPEYYEHLAEIYWSLGNREMAKECIDYAIKKGSKNQELIDKINEAH